MKIPVLILSVLVAILFVSCKNGLGKQDGSNQERSEVETPASTGPQEETDVVTLNDGQKWMADVETTRSIAVMQGLLGEFPANATEEDYRALHKKLITRYQSIVQKCPMEGDARLQLKKYLVPLKKMIDTLENGNVNTSNKTLTEMKPYLMKYSHYFL